MIDRASFARLGGAGPVRPAADRDEAAEQVAR
jgi:hypothetical protein